jgi:uncharacterized protein
MKRIVVDTNVFIGAILSKAGGDNREVLRRCLAGEIKPLMGVALLAEYEDLMNRRDLMLLAPISEGERFDLLEAFLSVCDWVKIYYLWRPNLRDEADNHLIELAVSGGAEVIITQNVRDLGRGELRFDSLLVQTPSEFINY